MMKRIANTLLAVALMLSLAPVGQAAVIVADPGAPGDYEFGFFFPISSDFTSEFGTTVSGQVVQFDLMFADMKYVQPPSLENWRIFLVINHESVDTFQQPLYTNAWLLDSDGDVIVAADTFFEDGDENQSLPIARFDAGTDPIFYGVRFDLTLPDYPETPTIGLVQVSFSNDEFWTIGIPEPASAAMLGVAFAFAAARRKRRNA